MSILEDIALQTTNEMLVREALEHWAVQRDYKGVSWDGVEAFNFRLATVADRAIVQSAGWYRYCGSTRPDMDGKDWRLLIPWEAPVSVNCHSLLHNGVWTLSTTIFFTSEVDLRHTAPVISNDDVWVRSMMWSIEVAKVLQTDGYNYSEAIADMKERVAMSFGIREALGYPENMTVLVNDWSLRAGDVARVADSVLMVSPALVRLGSDAVRDEVGEAFNG